MKKLILITIICLISANLFSQVYKLETVYKHKLYETYLSHWEVLESSNSNELDLFSPWGYHIYFDDWTNGAYEVEYYKGNAKEIYQFLNQIIEFTKKYIDEDKVLTYFAGVQVKTLRALGFRYTLVYDKENKVVCKLKLNQQKDMFEKFKFYCDSKNINYN